MYAPVESRRERGSMQLSVRYSYTGAATAVCPAQPLPQRARRYKQRLTSRLTRSRAMTK
jgi:hypothetical protein